MDPPYDWRTALAVLLMGLVLIVSGQRVELDRFAALLSEAILAQLGIVPESQVGRGLGRMVQSLFPIALEERREVARLAHLDRENLPWLARIERVETVRCELDRTTMALAPIVESKEFLIEPLGYLLRVLGKMLETIEIALWATLLSVLVSAPLAVLAAANYTPHRLLYYAARGLVSFLRAVPELVSALFLVLAFGFGPIAGILALGLHAAGFPGKFYAEDIEAADKKPQEALRALGASKLRVLRSAVLPQVAPSYVAYTLYILDRNVRMATVVGLVGAGGIGQELKGRWDLFEYDHVGTILVVIFAAVFLLDQVSARLRARLL
ncbi:MAG: phosphonate ABC transporter, permease protein PhnE [Geminicoccaceae bacterium]|nr:phosphonate ABC transporter, permease protein PhnE [Geminicoccaceae bacterium]